jgi:hypothetical protein
MASKQYHVPTMPDDEAHDGFHGLIAKLRSLAGVHDVTVDRTSKHVTVHLHEDEGSLSHVDQAILEFGQLPGFTGQA